MQFLTLYKTAYLVRILLRAILFVIDQPGIVPIYYGHFSIICERFSTSKSDEHKKFLTTKNCAVSRSTNLHSFKDKFLLSKVSFLAKHCKKCPFSHDITH
jgi:hypothetical protein